MKRPKKPATTEPPIPIKIVITTPPGSRPGIKSFAMTPTNNPTKIIRSIIYLSFRVGAPAIVFVVDLSTDAISEFETCHQSYVRMCFCLDQCCAIQHTYPDYCHKFESKKAIVCSPWGSMGTMFSYTQVHR